MSDSVRIQSIRLDAEPMRSESDLDGLVAAIGSAKIVLLGEASHGTSEFYTIRAALTKRLMEEKGFRIVAVEGDWPSCYEVNRYIKSYSNAPASAQEALKSFKRWPTWMWANEEIEDFVTWLRDYNRGREGNDLTGFYGLDVYSLWESMDETVRYLKETGSPQLEQALDAFSCFEPYHRDEQNYGAAAVFSIGDSCENEVVELLRAIRLERSNVSDTQEQELNLEMNSLVAVHAEQYYRAMMHGGPDSWNIRDRHMTETIERLLNAHGSDSKIIVWEHNTHIGDARATDMADEGMVNVGQLVRERFGPDSVYAVGFGTYEGTVIASRRWGAPIERMQVPRAMKGSWEEAMHEAGLGNCWINFRGREDIYSEPIGHRAIGVVYHPNAERYGNYVPSNMAARYDVFVFVDRTKALHPLSVSFTLV